MRARLLSLEIGLEPDLVLTRQRARQVARLLDLEPQDQTRLATAVSEIARNAILYAGGGRVEFDVETAAPATLHVTVRDHGSGIPNLEEVLEGRFVSQTGAGRGILGARRLTDQFSIGAAAGGGTVVQLGKLLPTAGGPFTRERLAAAARELVDSAPQGPFEELRRQNQELLQTLEELRVRQAEIERLNLELNETNQGVLALYKELDEKAQDLHRASTLKSKFLSNVSHELRTPLNSILNITRLLLDRTDGELTAEQEVQVNFVRKSASSLAQIVGDLLDLAKIEAGKTEVRVAEVVPAELLAALRGMFRSLATSGQVELIFEDASALPCFRTDEGKLSQILRNLIGNALKFTERGEVRVRARHEGAGIRFEVEDTGIGIAVADQERIFEEYTQLEHPVQKRLQGTGLGLPLSRKLARLLGGELTVHSAEGSGSLFVLALPLAPVPASTSAAEPQHA